MIAMELKSVVDWHNTILSNCSRSTRAEKIPSSHNSFFKHGMILVCIYFAQLSLGYFVQLSSSYETITFFRVSLY